MAKRHYSSTHHHPSHHSMDHESSIHGHREGHVMKDYIDGVHHKSHESGDFTITEDLSKVAMMPQEVVYKGVGTPYRSLPEAYEDTIQGVDRQIGDDLGQMHKGFKPTKV